LGSVDYGLGAADLVVLDLAALESAEGAVVLAELELAGSDMVELKLLAKAQAQVKVKLAA
jgi:hypothetical protein